MGVPFSRPAAATEGRFKAEQGADSSLPCGCPQWGLADAGAQQLEGRFGQRFIEPRGILRWRHGPRVDELWVGEARPWPVACSPNEAGAHWILQV
jgi:hypothetical protein